MRRLQEVVLWLGAALGLVALALGAVIAFFGFHLLVFRSGSMAPDIPTGAVALARTVPAADLSRGDVVSVIAEDGRRITHRIASTTLRDDTASLVLKGDANSTEDAEVYRVDAADRVVASLPWGGYVLAHALTPPGLVACGAVALMLVVIGFTPATDRARRGAATAHRRAQHRGRREGRRRLVAATVAVVLVGSAAVGAGRGVTGTWARFTDGATLASGSFAATRFLTCDAAQRGVATPYLYWKLDETQQGLLTNPTAADASGNNRTGQYQAALLSALGLGQPRACSRDTGTAVTFNGNDQSISQSSGAAALNNPNTFTLTVWFRTTTTRGGKLLGFGNARTGASGSFDRHLYMANDGRIYFGVYSNNTVYTLNTGAGQNDGRWHQATASLSTAGMKLYLDGTLVATNAAVRTGENYAGYWRVAYDNMNNGWTANPTSPYFGGTLDEVAVYTTALSDADVADLARAGR